MTMFKGQAGVEEPEKEVKREEENQENTSPGSYTREAFQQEGAISRSSKRGTDRWP